MSESIWFLKAGPWSDEPRFYPPGAHPATAQMRTQLAAAEQLRERTLRLHRETRPFVFRLPEMTLEPDTRPLPDTRELDEFIAYLKVELVNFESRESEVKAQTAAMLAR